MLRSWVGIYFTSRRRHTRYWRDWSSDMYSSDLKGMAVDVAYDGLSGREMAYVTRCDVVVLDRDLPGMHGDEICAALVASGALTRILMLTASGKIGRAHV